MLKLIVVFVLFLCYVQINGNYNSTNITGKKFKIKQEFNATSSDVQNINIIKIWKKYSIFLMKNSSSISSQCAASLERLWKDLDQNNLNALKIFDATGKLPSGLLSGNVNQFGDFNECLSVEEAKYCLAEIDFNNIWAVPYEQYKSFIHSHMAIRETFTDPKHRVPGFTLVRWGFCIPRECSSKDLENSIKESTGAAVHINPTMCQTSSEKSSTEWTMGKKISICLFLILVLFSTVASVCSLLGYENYSKMARIINCFDVFTNWNSLTSVTEDEKDVKSIHGIRALSALGLLMSHKTMALFYNPYMNRSQMTENLGMPWSVIGRTAILFTDCFMLISGFLNANSLINDIKKGKSMNFSKKILTRIFRITPNLFAVILFCTYVLPTLGSGPLWPMVIDQHSYLCKKYMWRNLIYIHNYFPFQDMCLTHTHQIGIDMQLFVVTPLIVLILYKYKKFGLYVTGGLALASTALRLWATLNYNLSHVVHFGITVSRMFDTANYSYIIPTHRATIYLMGVYLAYYLKSNPVTILPKTKSIIACCISFIIGLGTWLGPLHMSVKNYEYNRWDAAIYGTLSPITWGAAVAWAIFATQNGFGGIYDILKWNKFKYFTKISYSVYLVQFPVFFYNVGVTKHVDEFNPYHMLQIPETLAIILISIALTLFVEIPFINLKNVLINDVQIKQKNLTDKDASIIKHFSTRKSKLG